MGAITSIRITSTSSARTTAHLDSFGVAAGSTLMLPKQD